LALLPPAALAPKGRAAAQNAYSFTDAARSPVRSESASARPQITCRERAA